MQFSALETLNGLNRQMKPPVRSARNVSAITASGTFKKIGAAHAKFLVGSERPVRLSGIRPGLLLYPA